MQNEIQSEADAQAARLVTERLNEITERATAARRKVDLLIGVGIVAPFLAALLACCFSGPSRPLLIPFLIWFSDVSFIAAVLVVCGRLWLVPIHYMGEIARVGKVEAIPALLAALHDPLYLLDKSAACDALTNILPQMKASDAYLLTPAARQLINSWLTTSRDKNDWVAYRDDLRVAALKALEQVGDAKALPYVERLANAKPRTPSQLWVQRAAIDCLPMLRANVYHTEAARTLLRASQPETTDPKTLLRPASGAGQADNAELLRGAEPPETRE